MVGKGDNLKTVCYVENLVDFTLYIQSSINDSYQIYNYADFPHYKITFAPVASSLQTDGGSMGGFSYKKLYNEIGDKIDWFNTQCYNSFSYETYDSIIKNGYPPEKVVMGMISGEFTKDNFNQLTQSQWQCPYPIQYIVWIKHIFYFLVLIIQRLYL